MKTGVVLLGLAGVLVAREAVAADPATLHLPFGKFTQDPTGERYSPEFGELGSPGRLWEFSNDVTTSTSRVATERLSAGTFYQFGKFDKATTSTAGLVLRTDLGVAVDTNTSYGSPQGPLFSIGGRVVSNSDSEALELGVRLIPAWPGVGTDRPSALRLALNASLASGQADDARWLAFESFGYQVYLAITQRTNLRVGDGDQRIVFTAHYGGQTSLTPLRIPTWLGTQSGIVGNAFLELSAGVTQLRLPWKDRTQAPTPLDVQLGAHAEASLSSIWPGNAVLPFALEGFVAWSPVPWFRARAFVGWANTAASLVGPGGWPQSVPYGLRLTFYTG